MPRSTKKTATQSAEKATVQPTENEYSIDELARAAESTVRNVRAYQDRGLIPPPERRGRKGIYSDVHLDLLKLINQLLDRGYTLGNIGELLTAVQQGHDLHQLLGLEKAISSPFTDEMPAYFTVPELAKMFNLKVEPATILLLDRVAKLDLLEREGTRFRARSPRLLHVASELVSAGIDLADMLDILRMMRGNVQRVADELVKLAVGALDQYGDALPPPEDVQKLADLIWRLRPLAEAAMNVEAAWALEKATNEFLGDRIMNLIENQLRERQQ